MRRLPTATATVLLVLAGCSTGGPDASVASGGTDAEFLAEHELTGMNAREIIDHLDRLERADRPSDLMASIRPDELLLADSDHELPLDMPEDEFYLSVAPYADTTHDCFHHSLTTCTGELSEQDIQVRIVDDETGDVLVDERTTTFDNGFAGFWLPRDLDGTLEVTYDGLTGTADISTAEDGATCLTTVHVR